MDWFKFQVNDMAGAALSAAEDAAVGAWFRMLAACYRLENGGCFRQCSQYSDRQWISIASVDRAAIKVAESAGLVWWVGENLGVLGYDPEQEARATRLKTKGRKMAAARWGIPPEVDPEDAVSIACDNAAEKVSNAKGREGKGEEEKRREEESAEAAEPHSPPPPSEPPVLVFPCRGKVSTWGLAQSQIDAWAKLYPGLDVLGEMRKALAWCHANPSRQSTERGIVARLVNWLNRAADSSGRIVKVFGPNGQQMPLGPRPMPSIRRTAAPVVAPTRSAAERGYPPPNERTADVSGLVEKLAEAKGA